MLQGPAEDSVGPGLQGVPLVVAVTVTSHLVG